MSEYQNHPSNKQNLLAIAALTGAALVPMIVTVHAVNNQYRYRETTFNEPLNPSDSQSPERGIELPSPLPSPTNIELTPVPETAADL